MAFIVSLLLIWSISLILLIVDPKSSSNRWGSAVTFFIGLRYLADVINEFVISGNNSNNTNIFFILVCMLTSISFLFYPYSLILLSVSYINTFKSLRKAVLTGLLLVPIILIYIFVPLNDFFYPTEKPSYVYLTIWSSTGIIGANLILIIAYFRCESILKRKDIFLFGALIIPCTMAGWFLNFFLPLTGVKNSWRFNIIIIILLTFIYGMLLFKYGLLGIKLNFERKRLENTMKSISSGTQILTHAIKNEVAKISLCSTNIKNSGSNFEKASFDRFIGQNVDNIIVSSEYLIKLVSKIKLYMNDIVITKSTNNLSEIIENSLNLVMAYIKDKKITIKRNYSYGQYGSALLCDSIHLQEVFNNLLKNSIEAMSNGGEISISIEEKKNYTLIEFKDTGWGITNTNLQHVFDPFFSTKRHTMNFGLGLSYCYNVMQKHGGTISIESTEGKGTTVLLKLPAGKEKIIKKSFNFQG